jgi:hypothetical protein
MKSPNHPQHRQHEHQPTCNGYVIPNVQTRLEAKNLTQSLLVAVTRQTRLRTSTSPAYNRERSCVHHDDETEDAEEDVACFAEPGFGYCFKVEHWLGVN